MIFYIDSVQGPAPNIKDRNIVGHYSIDGEKKYHSDLSALKYYKAPKYPNRVNFNLNKDLDLTLLKEPDNQKLDFLVQWMQENFDRLKARDEATREKRWLEPEIVCFRGIMTTLLTTPYVRDGWIISASKLGGTIYLCEFDTDEKIKQFQTQTIHQQKSTLWGYKCEQYLLADTPSAEPNTSVPLNQRGEFCCIFQCQFGNTSLLYGAEMDGVDSQEIFKDTLTGKKVEFIEIKSLYNNYIKHNGEIIVNKGHTIMHRRLMKWYYQSYLVGIQRIICAGKDKIGIVRRVKEFDVNEIASLSQDFWSQKTCSRFCNKFLAFIKEVVREECDKCIYVFKLEATKNDVIHVSEERPESSEYRVLPQEYIDKFKQYKEKF